MPVVATVTAEVEFWARAKMPFWRPAGTKPVGAVGLFNSPQNATVPLLFCAGLVSSVVQGLKWLASAVANGPNGTAGAGVWTRAIVFMVPVPIGGGGYVPAKMPPRRMLAPELMFVVTAVAWNATWPFGKLPEKSFRD